MTVVRKIVDVHGNIYVHTRTGVTIPIRDQTEAQVPISLAGRIWHFETPGLRKELVTDPADSAGLILVITAEEAQALDPDVSTPFLVTDETGEERWAGKIRRRGW